MIRATAPKGGLDTVFKFCCFMIAIHIESLTVEWLLTGRFHMPHASRFAVSVLTAAPFVWLTLYAVRRSYQLHKQLVALAGTDMLTGLMNRRAFVTQMQARLAEAAPGYVLIVDADHFKQVNDTYGHAVGDLCLQAVADRLREVTTPQDVVARIGGEEFGLFVNRDPGTIAALGQQICAAIKVRHAAGAASLDLTLSAGTTRLGHGDTLEQAMRRADEALYRAKQSGRARLVTWVKDDTAPVPTRSEQRPSEGAPVLSPAAG